MYLASLILLAGLTYGNYRFAQEAPGGNDFLPRWLGTRDWVTQGLSPYDPKISVEAQNIIYGRPANVQAGEDLANFAYPLPIVLFILPFSLLPYTLARALWMTVLELCLPVLILMGIRLAGWRPKPIGLGALMLFSVIWYPGFRAVILGQFAVIEAVLVTAALLAIQRRMDSAAGVLLALSLAKPQLVVLLIPFVLLWAWSRGRTSLIVWTVGASVLLVAFFMLLMPDWPLQWIRQVIAYPSYTVAGSPISLLADTMPATDPYLSLILTGLALLYMLWEWVLAWGKFDPWFQWAAAMTLVVTQLVSFRTASTNYLVFTMAILLVFSVWTQRWKRTGVAATVVACLAMVAAPWALFLMTVQGNQESSWMLVPLPFFVLFGLWWVRWWVTRSNVLQIGDYDTPRYL